jgi:hypothetical protein
VETRGWWKEGRKEGRKGLIFAIINLQECPICRLTLAPLVID